MGNQRTIIMNNGKTNDARHKNTDLKVYDVVIPKDGLAGWGPANPSLGMTLTTEYSL